MRRASLERIPRTCSRKAVWVRSRVSPSREIRSFRNRERSIREATAARSSPGTTGLTRCSSPPDLTASIRTASCCSVVRNRTGKRRVTLVLAEVSGQVIPGDPREQDVHQNEVGSKRDQDPLELGRFSHRPHLVAGRLENSPQKRGLVGIVLDRENPLGLGPGSFEQLIQATGYGIPPDGLLEVAIGAAADRLDAFQKVPEPAEHQDG